MKSHKIVLNANLLVTFEMNRHILHIGVQRKKGRKLVPIAYKFGLGL